MVTIVRDRVQDLLKKGMTLEQVKAAKLTRDYDGIYARDALASTPDMFVEAVYRSLSAGVKAQRPATPKAQAPKSSSPGKKLG